MNIQLSEHFTYKKLLRFTFPSMVMMIVSSLYMIVDGLFVSNLVGDVAFSAVNIIMPVIMIVGAFGFMLGTGGSAVVAKTMGEGKEHLANEYFSMIITAVAIGALALSLICIVFMEPLSKAVGASELLLADSVIYGRILMAGSIAFMLQTTFQSFFVVAEKPLMGLGISVAAGLTNMFFDYLFISVLGLGLPGAAYATVLGYIVGGVIPLIYFMRGRKSGLRLVKPKFYGRALLNACSNGSSEMMSNVSSSIVSALFNIQLMKLMGEAGVAAFGVMMYVDFIFLGTFLGFAVGSAPIISYHYGAGNHQELKNLFKKSLVITGTLSAVMLIAAEVLSRPLSWIFVGYNEQLLNITVHGFRLFALSYVFNGFNVFSSAFFTALCNGAISAFLSFMRTFVLRGGLVLLLPFVVGEDGIWLSVATAELIGAVISLIFFVTQRKRYHYA